MPDTETSELEVFLLDLTQEVMARADANEEGAMREEELTQVFIEHLAEMGEIEDAAVSYHQARGVKANAFHIHEDGDRLDIFITEARMTGALTSVTKTEVDTAFKRLRTFLEKSLEGYHTSLEEASDGFDMAWSIHSARKHLISARFFLITDGITRVEAIEDQNVNGIEVSHHVWDIQRLHQSVKSGAGHEAIKVDFAATTGGALTCLPVPVVSEKYRCFLAVVPGSTIVELYKKFGPRLLERNVRSFLQLRGNVNKGIRATLEQEPEMFVAYNNGLSIVVKGASGEPVSDGLFKLQSTEDFQIVNGGQTTGSIYRAALRDKLDLDGVFVPIKITEITKDDLVDEVAPQISLYANSQNKVNLADFSSNHPFHVKLEELSRTIPAPPKSGMQKTTTWFFERARGQYLDNKSREGTPARQKAWEIRNPRRQMFTKTDLGKFENSWSQLPHVVSRGAQKSFLHFMDQFDKRGGIDVDEEYFRRLVAKAILFRETERIVTRRKFGGYRAQIVTHTIALLSHLTAQRIDLDAIWRTQELPEALANFIDQLSVEVHAHIIAAPGGQNVGEWSKREACWDKLREKKLDIPSDVSELLITRSANEVRRAVHTVEAPTQEEEGLIDEMAAVPSDTWFGIAKWSKETKNLQSWQRSLSFSLGRVVSQSKKPSRKQAIQGKKILDEATRLGFRNAAE